MRRGGGHPRLAWEDSCSRKASKAALGQPGLRPAERSGAPDSRSGGGRRGRGKDRRRARYQSGQAAGRGARRGVQRTNAAAGNGCPSIDGAREADVFSAAGAAAPDAHNRSQATVPSSRRCRHHALVLQARCGRGQRGQASRRSANERKVTITTERSAGTSLFDSLPPPLRADSAWAWRKRRPGAPGGLRGRTRTRLLVPPGPPSHPSRGRTSPPARPHRAPCRGAGSPRDRRGAPAASRRGSRRGPCVLRPARP